MAQALDGHRLTNPIEAQLWDTRKKCYHCRAASLPGGAVMLTIAPLTTTTDTAPIHLAVSD